MTDRPRFYVLEVTGYPVGGGHGAAPHTSYAVLDRAYAHREVAHFSAASARGNFTEMARRGRAHALAKRLNDGC